MAPREGLEPTTQWLTATCSTAELPRNKVWYVVFNSYTFSNRINDTSDMNIEIKTYFYFFIY